MAAPTSRRVRRIGRGLPSLPPGDLWVFGYGSLMWRPGFEPAERHAARLHGYHRALCVWSWVYRGTRHRPGLVLALDQGGCCLGRAFRVRAPDKHAVADYLYQRELITAVYVPMLREVRLASGASVTALTFRADRAHPQYAGRLSPAEAAATVARARGRTGHNREYVAKTVAHLEEMRIRDEFLERVMDLCDGDA